MAMTLAYTKAASYYHWLVAAPLIGTIGCVLYAQQLPKDQKKEKGLWMWRHKSFGLLTGMIVAPRLMYRIVNRAKYSSVQRLPKSSVEHLPNTSYAANISADISHVCLYTFMTVMPLTGIAMGMFGGKGVPFFWTTIPGLEKKNGKLAGQSFDIHKTLGTYGKFLVPIHTGAAVGHAAMGQKIFARINPFR